MASITVTPLDMPAIQKLNDTLFAINNSDLNRTKPRGTVHLLVNDASGSEVQINIPKTWIPVNLGEYCDTREIVKSSRFRELVRKGILVIISEQEATTLLKTEKAQIEAQKVRENEGKIAQAVKSSFAAADTRVVRQGTDPNQPPNFNNNPTPNQNGNNQAAPDMAVQKLVNDYRMNGMSDEDAAEATRQINGNKDSWIWASTQVHDNSSPFAMAIADKIAEFDTEEGMQEPSTPVQAAPSGSFVINV